MDNYLKYLPTQQLTIDLKRANSGLYDVLKTKGASMTDFSS